MKLLARSSDGRFPEAPKSPWAVEGFVTRLVERFGVAFLAFCSALLSLAYLPLAVVDAWRRKTP